MINCAIVKEFNEVEILKKANVAIQLHYDAIQLSNIKEDIETHIEAIDYIFQGVSSLMDRDETWGIKRMIKEGIKNWGIVQDKCIRLGVV